MRRKDVEIRSVDMNRYGKEIKRIDTEKKRIDCNELKRHRMESNGRKEN